MSKLFQLDLFARAMLAGSLIDAKPQTEPLPKGQMPPDKPPAIPPFNTPPAAPPQPAASPFPDLAPGGRNYRLTGERDLATTWSARASDNLAAMRLALEIVAEGRPATEAEQAKLIRFVGFGASKIATSLFPVGNKGFRAGWETLGKELHELVDARDFAALARSTQYAHYTPEFIVRALWKAIARLGFTGGMILEPGIGTGLFLALAPQAIADRSYLTGFEFDPTTARIAQLLHPQADIHACDFTAPDLDVGGPYDLAIGNPPFSDRQVSAGSGLRLSLHEYFIWNAVRNLRTGGLGAFVVSRYLMDKTDIAARAAIADEADLIAAIRMPEASMRWHAGTDVVVDLLFFRRRAADQDHIAPIWLGLENVPATHGAATVSVNRYFAQNPDMVLGQHAVTSSQYGPAYTCEPYSEPLSKLLARAIDSIPVPETAGLDMLATAPTVAAQPPDTAPAQEPPAPEPPPAPQPEIRIQVRSVAERGTVREGSYIVNEMGELCQIRQRTVRLVQVRQGRSGTGIPGTRAAIIRGLITIRDATRDILRAQDADRNWDEPLDRLKTAYRRFTERHGAVNKTLSIVRPTTRIVAQVDEDTGETTRYKVQGTSTSYRRPNLEPFMDDPDVWLVAAVENYDIETDVATPGPIFTKRVVRPPTPPSIANATDALAVVLNELGRVDIDRIAELRTSTAERVIAELGDRIFLDPETEQWELADAYLSGPVRAKLAIAEASVPGEPRYQRNVDALRAVQPKDLKPSDITARLGAPYIDPVIIAQFCHEVIGIATKVTHNVDLAAWAVDPWPFRGKTTTWGTHRRNAGQLLDDALNSRIPKIFDIVYDVHGGKHTELNVKETEAAKEKLLQIKRAFESWIWTDTNRADDLVRIYNAKYNNMIARKFDGSHLMLPGTSELISMRRHQLDGIWQIIASGTTYLAHVVGSGKTFECIAGVMEQRRLGLVRKAMVVVPGQTLSQWACEWLLLYPTARILVADEENFAKDRRQEFVARAATGDWDAIIITHSAFKFISAPAGFEGNLLQEQIDQYAEALTRVDADDRISRKRLENLKEKLEAKLGSLKSRKDDLLTISEIGVDQIVGDEFQAFRKLSFATNMTTLRGIDPDGSQRAWDMFVKVRYIDSLNPNRALVAASGTPITNTMAELYTAQRFLDPDALEARGVHQFDAWAASFCDTTTTLELQPNGKYKPITRFAEFINIPELTLMLRMRASVVSNDDIAGYMKLPRIAGGKRQIITAPPTQGFKRYQQVLDQRIKLIEERKGPPKKGDDILLAVITDGRHAAIDLRFVLPGFKDEPENKLNKLIDNAFAIYKRTSDWEYINPHTGKPYPARGAAQMIFSDLGTLGVEKMRGFSAYRWIKERLIALGVPESEIAFIQDCKKAEDKLRLFSRINAGLVRFVLGSSDTLGTGTNAQLRLYAEHHLDVPWLPAHIAQREGRIVRQGNQNEEIWLYAYATETSMDAPMWQTLERKAEFIAQALRGDASIRRLEDDPDASPAAQFAMAKAIASGDHRLMQQAGLTADIARLERLEAAHKDEQWVIRREIEWARGVIERAGRRIPRLQADIAKRITPTTPTLLDGNAEPAFAITVGSDHFEDRKAGSAALTAEIRRLWLNETEGTHDVGVYRGFQIVTDGGKKSFGDEKRYDLTLYLQLTERTQEITWAPDTMPHVVIQRLDKVIDGLEDALFNEQRWLKDASAKLENFLPRLGEAFPQQGELAAKVAELEALEADLASPSINGRGRSCT